ncbi:hypothetical protein NHX12_029038 [Muraenolepis orangiensis]|uniref:Short-chain dehydrogenase n=1 Tax=Muraenolepis orangiensis TaxID=630683 RepID=A0A9Q0EAG9_9TELE|nr:hypothetical protein NHX12_029038 [Muraenolepis orangiensis]
MSPMVRPQLARQGMNVLIISRNKEKLERTAKEIVEETGQRVKVVVADFTQDDVYDEIEDNLNDLEIGVLGFHKGSMFMLPEDFVRTSLQYLRAGDKTHGNVVHTITVRQPGAMVDSVITI